MILRKKCPRQRITYPLGSTLTWAFLFKHCLSCETPFFYPKNRIDNVDNLIILSAMNWLNSISLPIAAKGLPSPSQDLSWHFAIQQLWGRGSLEAADLGATPTQNIVDLLLCPCFLFFATNRYSPFPSWWATGMFECRGCPCTSGKRYRQQLRNNPQQ
jgi:hypothetical protein